MNDIKCDIIIPVWNEPELSRNCIEAMIITIDSQGVLTWQRILSKIIKKGYVIV